jgi:hypothetical protein
VFRSISIDSVLKLIVITRLHAVNFVYYISEAAVARVRQHLASDADIHLEFVPSPLRPPLPPAPPHHVIRRLVRQPIRFVAVFERRRVVGPSEPLPQFAPPAQAVLMGGDARKRDALGRGAQRLPTQRQVPGHRVFDVRGLEGAAERRPHIHPEHVSADLVQVTRQRSATPQSVRLLKQVRFRVLNTKKVIFEEP